MNKKIEFFILSLIFLLVSVISALILGSTNFSFKDLIFAVKNADSIENTIIFSVRFPRVLLNLICGFLLGSSGAVFQLYFRNFLAEPGIMGLAAASTFGAIFSKYVLGIVSVFSGFFSSMNFFAFLSSLIAGFFLCFVSKFSKNKNSITLLLFGMALGNFCSAVSSIIILLKSNEFSGIYSWILGSFNGKSWTEVKFILIPSVFSVILMIFSSRPLELMISGEENAKSLGVNVKKLEILILISSSLALSSAVCAGGTINFIGIIAPYFIRRFFKFMQNRAISLIFSSAVLGSILVILSDTFSRLIFAPQEIPAGIITSLLGFPFFISLIFKKDLQ